MFFFHLECINKNTQYKKNFPFNFVSQYLYIKIHLTIIHIVIKKMVFMNLVKKDYIHEIKY